MCVPMCIIVSLIESFNFEKIYFTHKQQQVQMLSKYLVQLIFL